MKEVTKSLVSIKCVEDVREEQKMNTIFYNFEVNQDYSHFLRKFNPTRVLQRYHALHYEKSS
jgi:hypothetical protein